MRVGAYRTEYGVHKPICNGRCLVAHMGWYNLAPLSALLIVTPVAVWYAFVYRNLEESLKFPCLVAFGLLTVLSLYYLITAQLTEPGILPIVRYEQHYSNEVGPRLTTLVVLDGREFPLPLYRAKVSRVTDNCIEKFDHYCPWIGNAVGRRNYRYFVMFVTNVLILALLLTCTCVSILVLSITQYNQELVDSIRDHMTEILLTVYGLIMIVSLFLLWQFHVRAIAGNRTTNEILKRVYSRNNPNPHDKGCLKNYASFCCKPVPKSKVAELDDDSPLPIRGRSTNGLDVRLLDVEDGSPMELDIDENEAIIRT
uniref:Palmitoyltransferase n=1 Tax=Aplanochytrium stocchinoi TaxID=215587 RepID=A0A7S3LLB4_9STRA